jgi:glycosyltransferase involved in cell wall biosynthesis
MPFACRPDGTPFQNIQLQGASVHRLRTADQWVREGRYRDAAGLLQRMAADMPDSLLIQQRLADACERAGDAEGALRARAEEDRIRARRGPIMSAMPGAAGGRPVHLIVDPIFRGSRLYYSAMLAEALEGVTDDRVRILTRVHPESDLLDSYRERLHRVDLEPTLTVPSDLWYGQIDAKVCGQIAERMMALPAGSLVFFAGWNEVLPNLVPALRRIGKRLPVRLAGYDYAAGSLADPAKREQLAQLSACVDSLTVWLLDESAKLDALRLPGVRCSIISDPIPHPDASPVLARARAERSTFVDQSVPAGHVSLLAVGLQSGRKGLRDIIRAARVIESESLPARVLLSGKVVPEEADLSPQVRALSKVITARNDYVSDEEILRTYNASDVVLLPYAKDFSGSSGVFAHAMAFGKPVIATEHGCVGWRTREFGVGLTYEANDVDGFVRAIRTVLGWSAAEKEAYRQRCLAYYQRNSYDATLNELRQEAREMASLPSKPAAATLPAAPRAAEPVRAEGPTPGDDTYSFDLRSIESIRQICLMDTGVGSRNMGDHIIVDSIKHHLRQVFPDAIFVNVPTHEYLGAESLKLMDACDVRLVCGTNLLASHMDEYKQWKIGGLEFAAARELTLMGCGWWQYQEAPNQYTELLLNRILSGKTIHSVRDSYSVDKLSGLQGKTVVNTTCPTLWGLTPTHLKGVPDQMARDVVTTLTDYKADPVADGFMLEHLSRRYRTVYVWIQGTGDYQYLKRLLPGDPGRVRVVPATLEAYDQLLTSSLDLDYVGTRLHAGVRALQKKRRALILAVDNRAREISADTGLPCLPRERAVAELEPLVDRFSARDIKLPLKNINRWLDQFR